MQHDAKTRVTAVRFLLHDAVEACRSVFERNTLQQLIDHERRGAPADSHEILTVDLTGGVHQTVCELTVCREEQQSRRVDVQSANSHPPARYRLRQTLEHSWPALRITPRRHFPNGLVIEQQLAHWLGGCVQIEFAAVEEHFIIGPGAVAKLCYPAGNGDPPVPDPLLDASAGAEPGGGH